MKQVYLDYAAATPCDRKILKLMEKVYFEFGNPSSIHLLGEKAKQYLEIARNNVAKVLNADSKEIIFLSGGTESVKFGSSGSSTSFYKFS